jgi:hypothetical protein
VIHLLVHLRRLRRCQASHLKLPSHRLLVLHLQARQNMYTGMFVRNPPCPSSDFRSLMLLAFRDERQTLLNGICTLVSWLYIRCGLSRAHASKVLQLVVWLVLCAIRFGRLFGHALGDENPIPDMRDVRTAIATLAIEPVLQRSVCCPKCFAPYHLDAMPEICPRRETARSRPCGERLWTTRQTKRGPKLVPRRLYTTQSFPAWLRFFLARPGIEDLLDKSYMPRPNDGHMRDVWDSPAWCSLGAFPFTYGNLVFSYYIDWFNPLTNKIAGKKVSCGAIMMFCLNLPPELRHLPENTFFAGLTPPPHEPNIVTITAVQDPIVDQLLPLYEQGEVICSFRHPLGYLRRVAVLPFIGDLMALQKACGFASHAHKYFCWFCLLKRDEIERLDMIAWPRRTHLEVSTAARRWLAATTKKERKALFDSTGVRWTSLLRLPYRDHVQHIILGVMHNWLEGILQHHARRLLGIGIEVFLEADEQDVQDADAQEPELADADMDDLLSLALEDDMDIVSEIAELVSDSQSNADTPSHARHLRRFHSTSLSNILDLPEGPADQDAADDDYVMADNESTDGSEGSDSGQASTSEACIFTAAELQLIRSCIGDMVLPTWVARPPRNLGDKSHGKLKADNWFILFTVCLLASLPEIWSSSSTRHRLLLQNFFDLVDCTNVTCSFSITMDDIELYEKEYVRYRQSKQVLFPRSHSVPNQHYAMHNGDLMRFWGPLMVLSEFPYERHNGTFQKVQTTNHLGKCGPTLLALCHS